MLMVLGGMGQMEDGSKIGIIQIMGILSATHMFRMYMIRTMMAISQVVAVVPRHLLKDASGENGEWTH